MSTNQLIKNEFVLDCEESAKLISKSEVKRWRGKSRKSNILAKMKARCDLEEKYLTLSSDKARKILYYSC